MLDGVEVGALAGGGARQVARPGWLSRRASAPFWPRFEQSKRGRERGRENNLHFAVIDI